MQLSLFDIEDIIEEIDQNAFDTAQQIIFESSFDAKRDRVIDWINKEDVTIIIAFSGGKDSIAMALYLVFELKIPIERIELWHHCVDGEGEGLFDWPCTKSYCQAFAKAFGFKLWFPKGLREIFETQDLEAAYEIIDSDDYDDLKVLTKEDLPTISAIQMFELIQLHHPTEYGLRIKREDLIIEWRKRGKKIFEELGLPTDNDYPYVNLKLGYFNVCKLKTVLDYELPRFNWWQVAENFRPMADLNKGIQILDELIEGLKKDKEKLVDKKTGKVLEKRGAARKLKSIEFDLERLEWSKSIVLNYLSEQKKGL